jgi:hypothetical protein
MDPLRPFTSLIRSLRSTRSERAAGNSSATASATPSKLDAVAEASRSRPVHARLQARLATLTEWNPAQARELFVECILLEELGAELERDPAFADLVRKVGGQLASEARIGSRLDQVLRALSVNRVP